MDKLFAVKAAERDNVVTVFSESAAAGAVVTVQDAAGRRLELELLDDVPYGHKAALEDIPAGEPIVKFGEEIGLCFKAVKRGAHVHTHNLASNRARGDRE